MRNKNATRQEIIKSILSKKDDRGRLLARESSELEFKENFNFGNIAKYGKTMAAFANNKGGFLLFGVKDSPRILLGINLQKFNDIKQEKITSFLLDHFSPEITWEIGIIRVSNRDFGYLYTVESDNKPIICKKNSGKDIKNGEIYYRYRAQDRTIEHSELVKIIDQIKEKERRNWLSLIKQIATIGPENSALLDIVQGKIEGQMGTLLIDEKLIPKLSFIQKGSFQKNGKPVLRLIGDVKPAVIAKDKKNFIVKPSNDPNAPIVRLTDDEIKKAYPWDFKKLTKELKNRYSDFKHNQKYHRIRLQLVKQQKYSFRRYLNPDNPRSSHQDFFAPKILEEFDKHYTKKNLPPSSASK